MSFSNQAVANEVPTTVRSRIADAMALAAETEEKLLFLVRSIEAPAPQPVPQVAGQSGREVQANVELQLCDLHNALVRTRNIAERLVSLI